LQPSVFLLCVHTCDVIINNAHCSLSDARLVRVARERTTGSALCQFPSKALLLCHRHHTVILSEQSVYLEAISVQHRKTLSNRHTILACRHRRRGLPLRCCCHMAISHYLLATLKQLRK